MTQLRLILLSLVLVVAPAQAEKFLSIPEAQKAVFPEATEFDSTIHRFSAEEIKKIEKSGGVKVRNRALKFWKATQDGKTVGILILDFVIGKHEVIDYVVGLNPDGSIRQVEILEYRESHGGQIRSKKWREQFQGKKPGKRLKLNEQIYNISGATLSCRHVTEGINRLLASYQQVLAPAYFSDGVQEPSPR